MSRAREWNLARYKNILEFNYTHMIRPRGEGETETEVFLGKER